jgi:hypothetical protein
LGQCDSAPKGFEQNPALCIEILNSFLARLDIGIENKIHFFLACV